MHTIANEADAASLRQRMLAVRESDVPQWGVMNATEMVCHLRGAFRVAMGEIATEPVEVPLPRSVIKAIALWAPTPWAKNFETVPVLKRGTPAMQGADFAQDRDDALREMERFRRPDQRRVDHAFFGPMSEADWMRWGYLHTDHHLRQFGH